MNLTNGNGKTHLLERGGTLATVALCILGSMAFYALWKWNETASILLIVAFKDVAVETIRNFNKNVDEVIGPDETNQPKEPKP